MAHGLKRTSSDFFVSAQITESALNTFTEALITLPLNSLDREVFVITGIILDPGTPSAVPATQTTSTLQLCRNLAGQQIRINDFNLIAESSESFIGGVAEFDFFSKTYGNQIMDSGQDFVDVVATPNMAIAVIGNNNIGTLTSQLRVFGYRAVADVGTYSALIASELNS
jgi:hypothetical protein